MRNLSWGQTKNSLLDRIIEKLRHNKILKHVKKGVVILDLGCGYNANLLNYLLRKKIIETAFGIDLSVNKSSRNIRLIKGRSDKEIQLPTESFDVITGLALIEHVKYPEIMLKEAYRLLKKNGILLLTTPSYISKPILEFLAFRLKIISGKEIADHKRYYDRISLKNDLVKAGFKPRKITVKYFQLGFNLLVIAKK